MHRLRTEIGTPDMKRRLVENNNGRPLYGQVKDRLTKLITTNRFKVGDKFHSLSEIADEYGVSQITARRVMDELAADGYIRTSQRKRPVVIALRAKGDVLSMARIAILFYSKSEAADISYDEAPWTSNVFSGVQPALLARRALWTMVSSESSRDAVEKLEMIAAEYDAFLCLSPSLCDEALRARLENTGRPYAIIQPPMDICPCNFVAADNYTGGVAVAEMAIKRGCRSFLYLASGFDRNIGHEKMRGFQESLLCAGVPPQAIHIRSAGGCVEDVFERFLEETGRPSTSAPLAVYSFGDTLSIGVLKTCARLGLKVPEEVGVAGSTGLEESAWSVPPLTTVALPMREMGAAAVEMVFGMLSSDMTHAPGVKMKVRMVDRGSM